MRERVRLWQEAAVVKSWAQSGHDLQAQGWQELTLAVL